MIVKIKGACPHDCPDTCGIITEVEDGRAIAFDGDPEHPVTHGWVCGKVRPYLDRVYHPDRLQYPLRRVGPKGSGQWRRISWEEAIGEIAERWQAISAKYGAEAILPFSYSGTLGLVQMSVTSARFWNRLGASRLARTICGPAAEFAVTMTVGARYSAPYDHVTGSKLAIIWGHNPASTAPHFMPELLRAQRNGCRLVVIDPRRSRTARSADWWLAPLPGTDGALALGLAHIIVAEGLHDEQWLAAHSVGWPELRARLAGYPPERVAAITGLAEGEIIELARLYAGTKPGLIKIADGICRNRNGGQNVRAICALPAITGQYGVRGAGLAYSTSGYLQWDREAVGRPADSPAPGRTINMNRLGAALLGEAQDPPVKALYVFGANPAAINPNAGKVVAGLLREDLFTVVHELFMTDTAEYADIVLPATSQLEHTDLHKGYGHTHLAYNRQAIAPLGEAKSNWDVMRLLAGALGFDDPWLQQDADQIVAEVLTATARRNPALQGITLEMLQADGAVPLRLVDDVPFAGAEFPTPSGRVELYSQAMADMGLDPLPAWQGAGDDGDVAGDGRFRPEMSLELISPAGHYFVTSSLANLPGLLKREGAPAIEIHPLDAASRRIAHGDVVRVENGRGWCEMRAVVTDSVRPGVAAAPKGHWSKHHGGRNINWTTSDELGDMAGQSTFHSNRVWISPVWRAQEDAPLPARHLQYAGAELRDQ